MNELRLLQPNQISQAAYKCDSTERKILFFAALCVQRQKYNFCNIEMNGYIAEFSISEMLSTLGMSNNQGNKKQIRDALEKITKCNIKIIDEPTHLFAITWLQIAEYDEEKNIARLCFTEPIGRLFLECHNQFSLISPRVIGSLKSFYSMRYYELALSYHGYAGTQGNKPTQWYFERSLSELREMFQVTGYKDKFGTQNFLKKVVQQPIAELNACNEEFYIDIVKIKDVADSRKLAGIRFICKKYGAKTKATTKTSSKRSQKVLKGINDAEEERKPFERFDTLYHEEFRRRIDELKCRNPLELEATAQEKAYKSMVADGYK
jgi:plasmid replication initiation protein